MTRPTSTFGRVITGIALMGIVWSGVPEARALDMPDWKSGVLAVLPFLLGSSVGSLFILTARRSEDYDGTDRRTGLVVGFFAAGFGILGLHEEYDFLELCSAGDTFLAAVVDQFFGDICRTGLVTLGLVVMYPFAAWVTGLLVGGLCVLGLCLIIPRPAR